MRLSFEQIRAIMTGCLDAVQEQGAVRFHRFAGALADFYRSGETSRIRLNCPSGVRLRFVTNARSIRCSLRFGEAARRFYCGVTLLNGVEHSVFGPAEPAAAWEGFALERAENKSALVDIWLPHLVSTELVALELEDGALLEPAPAWPGRWLALGDSITQGMTVRKPTDSWFARIALACGLESFNYGIGGAVMHEALAQSELVPDCTVVSLAFGTNDVRKTTPDVYEKNMRALLAGLARSQPKARVLVITPIPFLKNEGPQASGFCLDRWAGFARKPFRMRLRHRKRRCAPCLYCRRFHLGKGASGSLDGGA